MPATADSNVLPRGIAALAERYDPDVIDVPGGGALIRLRVVGGADWDARITGRRVRIISARDTGEPDALISADPATWLAAGASERGGLRAFGAGRLRIRGSLHLGIGFLAATSGSTEPGRLSFETLHTDGGLVSILSAGTGRQTLLCLHGLGATKASFLPTVAALSSGYRVVAMDLPGFGESDKPIGAPYDAAWFARSAFETLDALGVKRAWVAGNSMGGRVAIEAGLMDPGRVRGMVLLSPALAWLRDRRWAALVRLLRPELGLLQVAPRSVVEGAVRRLIPAAGDGWAAAGMDEFLRSYLTPARPRRLLCRGAQHLPRRAARRGGLLDPARVAAEQVAVRVGPPRHARADRIHEARGAGAARRAPSRAGVRARAAARAAARDARGDARFHALGLSGPTRRAARGPPLSS